MGTKIISAAPRVTNRKIHEALCLPLQDTLPPILGVASMLEMRENEDGEFRKGSPPSLISTLLVEYNVPLEPSRNGEASVAMIGDAPPAKYGERDAPIGD
mmetsp:Transcript_13572/g.18950  ORF Transcript_13572/g.18950 Transcript_13572/m.18950 type:complete len:100 (+) Transcript_13572:703-1002(+)